MTPIYIRSPNIAQGKDENGPYLYNTVTGDSARIDDAMLFIWMLCDGKKDVSQIARDVAEYTGEPPAQVQQLVINLINSLENLGFVRRIR